MAEIRVYIQPRLPAASSQTAFYDFSKHVEFDTLGWEQNDQGNASTLSANIYSIMPVSSTHWLQYPGATQADKIQNALYDQFYHLKVYPRTEIQIRDVSTNPHTILWGGVITRVSEQRDGGAIVGSIEAIDYTALLNESVALEFTPLANSTIKQTITSQTYSFTPSFAERTAGLATITVDSIAVGSPYSRNLEVGDTIVVNLSDDTYDGVHKITGVAIDGSTYKLRFQQYSNVADAASSAVTGTVKVPGFMTTDNAPSKDSRINVNPANIADLNPDWKWSPRNPDISRAVSNVARTGTTVTITTSAQHGFGKDRVVTINLTNGPTGYADANGSFVIATTPTDSTFTYETTTSGTITSGAAVGTVVCAGEITPTPMKGGTLARNLQYAVERGTGCFYLNEGTLDGGGALTIDLFVRPKNLIDLVTNGLFDATGGTTTAQTGWDMGSWLADTSGTSGPYGVGNTLYYTGSDHQDAEMASAYRISVTAGEKYFVSWRHYSDKDTKERPRMKYYDSGGTVVGNSHGYAINQHDPLDDEWHRDWGIVVVPANAAKMSFVLHHEEFSSSYTARFTDIQIIKITGSYGFSDHPIEDTATYGMTLNTFENPSAPSESGESSNRIYVYAPYTTEDPITGAKMLTSYRNTYDFAQGVWEAGGKRIEGSIVELNATDSETALLTAQQYFRERGQALKSFEFEHTSGKLSVGDVIPFIWDELGIAEALVVRKQIGYLIGQEVYYRVQLGGDLAFQRSTMYLVEQRLREISGDAAYFSPPPSPYPGTPTEGGIVVPAVPTVDAGQKQVELTWQYPQSIINSSSFGGFIVLRGSTEYVGGDTVSATGDGTYATITTTSPHGLAVGDEVIISTIVPASYRGGYTVTAVPSSTQFSFANSTTASQTTIGSVSRVTNWYKASTGEPPVSAENPLAPESAVPSYTDTNLTPGQNIAYKVAAIDVSGSTRILSEYSQISAIATPTDVSVSFDSAYTGLGINVPKLVNSVTHDSVTETKPISSISRTAGSFTATVTTAVAHGFSVGMPVGIGNTSNDAAIKGFYKIISSPAPTTTTFSITTLDDTVLSITGGSTNGYGDATARTNLSPNYYDDNGVSRALGDAYSLTQFPVGQIAFSQGDGKLYRNGMPGTAAFDDLWVRAAVDAIDVSPDGSIRISADRVTAGTLDAGIVNVTNLNATNIATGKLTIDEAWGANAGSATVLYKAKRSGTATLWTATQHGFAVSDNVYVHTTDIDYDGVNTITGLTAPIAREARIGNVAGVSIDAADPAHNFQAGESITTTGLSADLNGTFTVSAVAASVTHAARVGNVAVVRTSQPHTFSIDDSVTITGAGANFNVSNQQPISVKPTLSTRLQGSPIFGSTASNVATLRTTNPHGFIVGDSVAVTGSGITAWNATQTVTAINFDITDYQRVGTSVTLRTSQYHGIQNSDPIVVSGLGAPYDGTHTVNSSFGVTSSLIRSQRLSTNAIITTAGPHGYKVGDSVVVSGLAASFNGTHSVTATSVAITSKAQSGTTATLTTTVPHGFLNGDTVVVSGVGAPWDTTGAVISGVSASGNPTTFQYTVGTSATVGTTAATGSADNGKRFTYALASNTTAISTTSGAASSYATISYTLNTGSGTVLLTAATGSPTVENAKTFSFTSSGSSTTVPTSTGGGNADSYRTFTYTSSSSGMLANAAITPNGLASSGRSVYFTTPSTSGTIPVANNAGTITDGKIIQYAISNGTDPLTSVASGTVVKKTDIYAIQSPNFSVDIDGNINATNAALSGTITAASGSSIGLFSVTPYGLDVDGIIHLNGDPGVIFFQDINETIYFTMYTDPADPTQLPSLSNLPKFYLLSNGDLTAQNVSAIGVANVNRLVADRHSIASFVRGYRVFTSPTVGAVAAFAITNIEVLVYQAETVNTTGAVTQYDYSILATASTSAPHQRIASTSLPTFDNTGATSGINGTPGFLTGFTLYLYNGSGTGNVGVYYAVIGGNYFNNINS